MSVDGYDRATLEEDGTLKDGEWKKQHRYGIGRISSLEMAARGTGRAQSRRGGKSEARRHALIKGFVTSSVMCQDDNQSSR